MRGRPRLARLLVRCSTAEVVLLAHDPNQSGHYSFTLAYRIMPASYCIVGACMPAKPETPLDIARHRALRCETRVADQIKRIAQLTAQGLDTQHAKQLLSAQQAFLQIARLCVEREEEKERNARAYRMYGRRM
jgi:hypothetical protein